MTTKGCVGDYIGKIYHKWTVISRDGIIYGRVPALICKCECGKERRVGSSVLSGKYGTSCGCDSLKSRGLKLCRICLLEKHMDEFDKKGAYKKSICKPCRSDYYKSYYKIGDNGDKQRARTRKNREELKSSDPIEYHARRYKTSREWLAYVYSRSEGICEICKSAPHDHIDHCHLSGDVRGLLCKSCNIGLGLFKDNTTYLSSAVLYLQSTESHVKSNSEGASPSTCTPAISQVTNATKERAATYY